jgi:exonuclease VII small subunit
MCNEHAQLLKNYQKAVATFSEALEALEAARATVSRDEYQRMAGYVDQAHTKWQHARDALQQHTAEHGCYPSFGVDAKATTA